MINTKIPLEDFFKKRKITSYTINTTQTTSPKSLAFKPNFGLKYREVTLGVGDFYTITSFTNFFLFTNTGCSNSSFEI